ncbi:MAG TPA: hypothetical protein VFY40_06980 [Blastocatellia bacterium]|nr:hypothetical protein [Blastocatellia bacterium]
MDKTESKNSNLGGAESASLFARYQKLIPTALFIGVFAVDYFSYPHSDAHSDSYYDYTFRIAQAILDGKAGLTERPPEWLNEMVPLEGRYYSVFPLGSVLTILPVAAMKRLGFIELFPGSVIAALIAGAAATLCYLLSGKYGDGVRRRLILTLLPVFGTWMWANLAFSGAWHIALGFAVVSQLGALYFILIAYRPALAGLFFALAFGNRTELILLSPIFFYLIIKHAPPDEVKDNRGRWTMIARFAAIPFALGILTLGYNYARFSSIFDFGYARIPGVLNEPWYQHGIFSIQAIPGNAWAMLIEPGRRIPHFPYLMPTGFGGSIFLSCPFLIYLFRRGARDAGLKNLAWIAVALTTLTLWLHGNTGGWQISYRYAMVLLPWMVLILLENAPKKVGLTELALLLASIAINAYSTWLFLWKPQYISG